jgi:hypothetical protein
VSGETALPNASSLGGRQRNRSNAPTDGSAPAAGMSVAIHIARIRIARIRIAIFGPLPAEFSKEILEGSFLFFSHGCRSDGGCIVDSDW